MKAVCPFDKNHNYSSEDQLRAHIQKCKSPNRSNFEQCKFNADHWVNFSKIKQHQKQCSQQVYSSRIELTSEDSFIRQFIDAIDSRQNHNHSSIIQQEIDRIREDESRQAMRKKRKNKKPLEEEKDKLWVEPSFKKWLLEKTKPKSTNSNNSIQSYFQDS